MFCWGWCMTMLSSPNNGPYWDFKARGQFPTLSCFKYDSSSELKLGELKAYQNRVANKFFFGKINKTKINLLLDIKLE